MSHADRFVRAVGLVRESSALAALQKRVKEGEVRSRLVGVSLLTAAVEGFSAVAFGSDDTFDIHPGPLFALVAFLCDAARANGTRHDFASKSEIEALNRVAPKGIKKSVLSQELLVEWARSFLVARGVSGVDEL